MRAVAPAAVAAVCGMAALAAIAPSPARAMPAEHPCVGLWVGEGRNPGSVDTWTIELNLSAGPSGAACGTIEYPSLSCGGTLEACRVMDGDIHTSERYTHDQGQCEPAGEVIIRCEGDRMRYSWLGSGIRVDTLLRRPVGWRPAGAGATTTAPPGPTPMPAPATPTAAQASDDRTCRCQLAGAPGHTGPIIALALLALARRRRRMPTLPVLQGR